MLIRKEPRLGADAGFGLELFAECSGWFLSLSDDVVHVAGRYADLPCKIGLFSMLERIDHFMILHFYNREQL